MAMSNLELSGRLNCFIESVCIPVKDFLSLRPQGVGAACGNQTGAGEGGGGVKIRLTQALNLKERCGLAGHSSRTRAKGEGPELGN